MAQKSRALKSDFGNFNKSYDFSYSKIEKKRNQCDSTRPYPKSEMKLYSNKSFSKSRIGYPKERMTPVLLTSVSKPNKSIQNKLNFFIKDKAQRKTRNEKGNLSKEKIANKSFSIVKTNQKRRQNSRCSSTTKEV